MEFKKIVEKIKEEIEEIIEKGEIKKLREKEIVKIVNWYYINNNIRNLPNDCRDFLEENLGNLKKELLNRGYIWTALEINCYGKNNKKINEKDIIKAIIRYKANEKIEEIEKIKKRFPEKIDKIEFSI